ESAMGATSYDRLPRWANLFASYDRWRYRHWESRVFRHRDQLIGLTEHPAFPVAITPAIIAGEQVCPTRQPV
ncbi:hypothetical protein QCD79_34560, partial [Pseudomonas quasicaspiana]|nr:hypothetical protein [Pseudomonas quasicaspiana]